MHALSAERPMGHPPSGRPPTSADRPALMAPFPHSHPGLNEEGVTGLDCLASCGPDTGAATGALLSARGNLSFADAAHLRDYTSSLSSLGDSNRTSPASATQGTEGAAHAHLGLYGLGVGIGGGGGTLSSVDGAGGDGVAASGSGPSGGWVMPTSTGTPLSVTPADFVSCGSGAGGGTGGGGSSVAGGGGGGGRPQHLSASIALHAGGGDPRKGIHASRAEAGDRWERQDSRGGASTAIDTAPDSGLTHPLYDAIDGIVGYPGVDSLMPVANDRHVYDSFPLHPGYVGVGNARGAAIWQPPPFADTAPIAEEAQYQHLAGVGPWTAAVGGDRNHGGTEASAEAASPFPCPPRAYEVHSGPTGTGPAAVASLRQPSREPTFQEVHNDVRERLRRGDSSFDGAPPGADGALRGGHSGGGGGTTDGEGFASAHIWSFGEALAKEGVPPTGALGHAYNPWSVRGWRTYTAADELSPPPPSDAPPH